MAGASASAPLNRRLFLLAAASILPLAAMTAFALVAMWQQQRAQAERAGQDIARALSTAVDAELQRSISVLEAMSRAIVLEAGDLQGYHRLAQRVVATQPQWLSVVLHDTEGRMLFNTRLPFGAPLPETAERESLAQAARSGRPVVGRLVRGALGTFNLAVRVPIVQNGQHRYVLSAVVKPAGIVEVVDRQRLPPDWVVSVFDANRVRVARSRQHEEFLGKPPAPSLAALMDSGPPEGTGLTFALEGDRIYTAYSRSPSTGWTVAIGIPAALVERSAWHSLLVYGGGVLLSFGIAVVAALALGRLLLERARKAQAEADALASVAAAVNATLETPRVLQAVAEAVRRVTAADLVRIALPDGDDGALVYRYLSGTRAQGYDRHRIMPGKGFAGRVMQTLKPYRTADAPNDPNAEPYYGLGFIRDEGVRTAMVVPIVDGGALQGIIYAARRELRPFSDDDQVACEHLSAHAAIALRNAALYRGEQAAREQAEQASRAKDAFLAMLGHELRNPLSAIANASQLLDEASTAQYGKDVIRRQVRHLTRMTDDLLDAARAMTGKIVLQREPLDLAAAVGDALAALRASGQTSGYRLVESLQPAWVRADAVRIEQIICNLVLNAVKYSPANTAISVATRREGDQAVLSVADEGIGMTRALLERVFDPFVQGEHDLARARGGLGLGLTLVRRLAELHGGQAQATSDGPGRGSLVTVRLPAIEAPAVQPQPQAPAAPPRSREILLVEDNDDARESLRTLLEHAGHRVRSAADGPSGLEAMRSRLPDLALIDIGLPHMDGYELVRRVRSLIDGRPMPYLVALTGYGLPEDRNRAFAAGFDAHLVKPVDPGKLQELLGRLRDHPDPGQAAIGGMKDR